MSTLSGPRMLYAVADSLQRDTTAKETVGVRAYSDDGEFVYVGAAEAITASGDPVSVAGALSAVKRGDRDTEGAFLGIAEAPFASGEYGYVRVKGPASTVVASGAVAGDELELSGTEGQLKKITTSGVAVAIALEASDDASTAVSDVLLLGR